MDPLLEKLLSAFLTFLVFPLIYIVIYLLPGVLVSAVVLIPLRNWARVNQKVRIGAIGICVLITLVVAFVFTRNMQAWVASHDDLYDAPHEIYDEIATKLSERLITPPPFRQPCVSHNLNVWRDVCSLVEDRWQRRWGTAGWGEYVQNFLMPGGIPALAGAICIWYFTRPKKPKKASASPGT